MSIHNRQRWRSVVTAVTTVSLIGSLVAPMLGQQTAPAPKPVAAAGTSKPVAATGTATPVQNDGGWPRDYATSNGGAIRIFQPQVANWDGQRHMSLYAAVSYSATPNSPKPALGTLKIEADSTVALDDRLVNFTA